MGTQQLERDAFEPPVINSWRQAPVAPTDAQARYAESLCRSELPYAERVATIETFGALDYAAMSELIDRLVDVRERRMRRLRREVHGRRR